MAIYTMANLPAARNDGLVHGHERNLPRALCGAGYNWPTDIKFSLDPDEMTCTDCEGRERQARKERLPKSTEIIDALEKENEALTE